MKCSLGISNFLEEISSLSHSIVFLYFFALISGEGFLISPGYSLELCIQTGIFFLSVLPWWLRWQSVCSTWGLHYIRQDLLLQLAGSVVVAHRFNCPASCGNLNSQTRDQTHVPCIARQNLNHCSTRDIPRTIFMSRESSGMCQAQTEA